MNFVEQYIFEKLKDKSFMNKNVFLKVVGDIKIDTTKVYRNIVNYQIQKYGRSLNNCNLTDYPNFEKINQLASSRKYQKRNYEIRGR